MSTVFDCQACGACCCNAKKNMDEGVAYWVPIEDKALLWRRRDLVHRLVTRDVSGKAHLKLDGEGRCAALRGKLGRSVECSIYAMRPHACRRVQPGDRECLRARSERLAPHDEVG